MRDMVGPIFGMVIVVFVGVCSFIYAWQSGPDVEASTASTMNVNNGTVIGSSTGQSAVPESGVLAQKHSETVVETSDQAIQRIKQTKLHKDRFSHIQGPLIYSPGGEAPGSAQFSFVLYEELETHFTVVEHLSVDRDGRVFMHNLATDEKILVE